MMDARTVSALTLLVAALLAPGGGSEAILEISTGHRGQSLRGKMFTLTRANSSVSFFPSYSSSYPESTTPPRPSPTRRYPTTTYSYWTTAPPRTTGVSVCVRYMAERGPAPWHLFTLSASSSPLQLWQSDGAAYWLNYNDSRPVSLTPDFTMWSPAGGTMWTSVCVSVDGGKNLVQVFRDSRMSIRKLLPSPYVWSGEPVIEFPGFDGQLTDVQVWDYPLLYQDIYNYMNFYGVDGSVLRWSSINFFLQGNALLENDFKQMDEQPIRRGGGGGGGGGGRGGRGGGRRLKQRKMLLKSFPAGENRPADI